jgi:small subunit ribosomal protein S8
MKNTLWNIVTDLKNTQISRRNFMYCLKTKLIVDFLNILWNEGYILGYKVCTFDSSLLKIFFKYKNGNSTINSLKFISKPSRSIFYSFSQLYKLDSKKNLVILSTSQGLMTVNECKQAQIGGKLLLLIK